MCGVISEPRRCSMILRWWWSNNASRRRQSRAYDPDGGMYLRADPRRDALVLRILGRRRLHQGPHQRLIRRNPVGDCGPLRAVPLLELHTPAPLMIATGEGERGEQALCPQLLKRCWCEREMVEPPLHLRAGQGVVAKVAHGGADGLCDVQGLQHAPDPIDRADLPF